MLVKASLNVQLKDCLSITQIFRLEPHTKRLSQKNITKIFKMYDVIIDGSDNFETRYLVNDACVILGKPLVFGAIFKFSGQLSVFNFENGPTYRCLFPNPPGPDALPPCGEAGVLGVLPGIIGAMQALESIKIITGVGEVMSGRVLLFDSLGQRFNELKLSLVTENQKIKKLETIKVSKMCHSPMQNKGIEIKELNPDEFVEFYKNNSTINVIDVRESWERELEHIQPSKHIPLGEFYDSDITDLLPQSRSDEIVVYCKAGVRSMDACRVLNELGFERIYNLEGGMMRWRAESMPLTLTGKLMPKILLIGGSDGSCGAGVFADFETIKSLNSNANVVVTSVTSQNDHQFEHSLAIPPANIKSQLDVIAADS